MASQIGANRPRWMVLSLELGLGEERQRIFARARAVFSPDY